MTRRTRTIAAAAGSGLLALTALSGCQLLTPNVPVRTPTALEACATGHVWELDTAAFEASARTSMVERGLGVTVAVSGSQRLTWDTDFAMAFDTDLTFTGTIDGGDPGFVETLEVAGQSRGFAPFSNDIAVPRNWVEDLRVTETATLNDEPADPQFTWIPLWVDDTVGLRVTCSPEQLELAARQGPLVWTFSRVS